MQFPRFWSFSKRHNTGRIWVRFLFVNPGITNKNPSTFHILTHEKSMLNYTTLSISMTSHDTFFWQERLVGGLFQREKHPLWPSSILFGCPGMTLAGLLMFLTVVSTGSFTCTKEVSLLCILSRQVNAQEECGYSLVMSHISSAGILFADE